MSRLVKVDINRYKNRLAIVGSRTITSFRWFRSELDKILDEEEFVPGAIISGGARGVDSLAERWARSHRIPLVIFYPEWNKYGKRAGFIRNQQIVGACDKLVAFIENNSAGTVDSISLAKDQRKLLKIIAYTEREQ